ncbi:MAG: MHYT domain-containing protein [Xanthomonadaceae bacterium]|nr:MHYT domain-containing protein [Xanthomonadaceae bacterium]
MHHTQCVHDLVLVGLSFLIAVLGSFAALQLAVGIGAARSARERWYSILLSGAALGGGGIWAMHFIGMLACKMNMQVQYGTTLTMISALVAIAACSGGLALYGQSTLTNGRLVLGGIITGLGVAGMHYMGMAAMVMPADAVYNPGLVALSLGIAVGAATAALWLAFNFRGWEQMAGGALLMGIAVSGMHYTGMAAVTFAPTDGPVELPAGGVLGGEQLGILIFVVAAVLLAGLFIIGLIRQRQREAIEI